MRTPDSQPHDESEKMERYGLENLDQYEREKIEQTARSAEFLAGTIRNYLRMVDFCTEKGIHIQDRTDLSHIKDPGQPAGPEGDLRKLLAVFQRGQVEIIGNIPGEFKDELSQRMEK